MVCGCRAGGLTAAPAGSRRGLGAAPAARIPCETSSVSRPGEVWGQGWCWSSGLSWACWTGVGGSDSLLLIPEAARVIAASEGAEPGLLSPGVLHVGGGQAAFLRLLDEQLRRRSRGRVAGVDEDPAWILRETGVDPLRRRVTESLFTLGAGGIATRGSVEEAGPGEVPLVLAAGIYDGGGA
jgi:Glycosyl hydrolase family 65, N-terminal domain